MINEREKKFIRLALDPAAKKGEIDNAAVMFINSLRARGVTPEKLDLTPGANVANNKKRYTFPNWGKHKNQHFDQIDPSYLLWVKHKWYPNLDDEGKRSWAYLYNEIEEYML